MRYEIREQNSGFEIYSIVCQNGRTYKNYVASRATMEEAKRLVDLMEFQA